MLPAPVTNTIKLGSTPVVTIIGPTIPAVVKPATVEDPSDTRIIAAILQAAKSGGIFISRSNKAICSLIPASIKTCFNPPAPPTINNIIDISLIESVMVCMRSFIFLPFFKPKL